jgi:hypothetical protein
MREFAGVFDPGWISGQKRDNETIFRAKARQYGQQKSWSCLAVSKRSIIGGA